MDKTDKILKTLQPRPQDLTPIGTEIIIPNHSGITGSQQAKNKLDARYITGFDHTQPVRALDTIYQNTSGRPLTIYGSIKFAYDDNPDFPCYATVKTGASNPPTTTRQIIGNKTIINFIGIILLYREDSFSFWAVVPTGQFYTIAVTVGGAAFAALDVWNEISGTTVPA